MHKIYNDENKEMPHRQRDDISFFEDDEKYAIKEGTQEETQNPNYTKETSDAFKKHIYVTNLLNSGNITAINEYNKGRCNPSHEDYDYAFARQNAKDGYGPINEQLDMQYHGTWEAHVKGVKEKYPKIGS